ncbi:hypothetical protein GXB85_11390 [Cellulomonas sp. APG4]|uniref:hypothetical protein n=1 Tax=Cellulomonas sp. APG4 TaxID=1538656 RepID=UPI00137AEBD8|nr:hypothetical protein [Cellulomonas sp. APG4]NCT91551.1 hypothetical protein [Cellulomonas sp. APG4]
MVAEQGTRGAEQRVTRRSLHRPGRAAPDPPGVPRLPVTWRPRRRLVVLIAVVAVVQPGRRGSLLLLAIQEGPGSRAALVSLAFAVAGLALAVLFARGSLSLRSDVHGRTVLVHQGLLRRREVRLSDIGEVCVVDGPARRVLLLDRRGGVIAVLGACPEFWQRPDVHALLGDEGVAVRREILLDRAVDIEAAYPGSTAWVERSKLRLFGVVAPLVLLGVFLLAWLLEA